GQVVPVGPVQGVGDVRCLQHPERRSDHQLPAVGHLGENRHRRARPAGVPAGIQSGVLRSESNLRIWGGPSGPPFFWVLVPCRWFLVRPSVLRAIALAWLFDRRVNGAYLTTRCRL